MTSEEKLRHFEDSVIGRAGELSDKMLKEYQMTLTQEEEACRAKHNQEALAKIKTEIGHLKRDCNTSLAREQLEMKRQFTKKTGELTRQIFDEVTKKLQAYRETEEYEILLAEQIRKIREIAGDREFRILISPLDGGRKKKLETSEGIEMEISEKTFLGGVLGYVDHGRILIDDSFDSRLKELEENFTFEGGISHE